MRARIYDHILKEAHETDLFYFGEILNNCSTYKDNLDDEEIKYPYRHKHALEELGFIKCHKEGQACRLTEKGRIAKKLGGFTEYEDSRERQEIENKEIAKINKRLALDQIKTNVVTRRISIIALIVSVATFLFSIKKEDILFYFSKFF